MEPNNIPRQPVRPVNPAGAGAPRPAARPVARPVTPRPVASAPVAEPVEPVEPKEANEPTFDNGPSVVGKKERKTGWVLALILLFIIAAGGVGFGVWTYLDSNTQKDQLNSQINDLQQQNAELQDELDNVTIINIDADGVKNANFGFRASNAEGISGDETMTVCSGSFTNICYSLSLDGKVTAEFYSVDWEAMGSNIGEQQKRETDDLSGVIDGVVVNIATGHIGNGAFDTVFFLISDGSVVYMQEEDILSQKYNARVLDGANNIIEVYGNRYNIDCVGFVQDYSGKIRRIVLDSLAEDNTVNLKVE